MAIEELEDIEDDSFQLLCDIVDAFDYEALLPSLQKMTVRKILRARRFLYSTKKVKDKDDVKTVY